MPIGTGIHNRLNAFIHAALFSGEDSGAVARVDAHVFCGEIASPEAGDTASSMQIHDDWYILR